MTKTHIVIHHSATTDGATLSWQAIRNYHLGKGWSDVGYNLGVELVGEEYEVLLGRPLNAQAAGEPKENFNRKGIHVCFVGNYDTAPPKLALWKVGAKHITAIMELLHIPITNVVGHREIANVGTYKQCPGKLWNMDHFRTFLEEAI